MTLTNREIFEKFANGATKGKACNMFIEGNILYDYGHHFPLLVRMPWGLLQNADKYSVTTSKHQGYASKYADIMIPFSVLSAAGIVTHYYSSDFEKIELIDKSEERWDHTGYKREDQDGKMVYISIAQYEKLSNEDNEKLLMQGWDKVEERRPSAVVIKSQDKFYLSSMDGWNYFLSLLPHPVSNVMEAFECLLPKEASGKEDIDYLRQGEWFFIPANGVPGTNLLKQAKSTEKSGYQLLPRQGGTGHHTVTKARFILGLPYVKGTVRHSQRDHKMLKLGNLNSWYLAVESNHVQSWGASGRVD